MRLLIASFASAATIAVLSAGAAPPPVAAAADGGLVYGWPVGTGELLDDGRVVVASRNHGPQAAVAEVAADMQDAEVVAGVPAGGAATVWGSAREGSGVLFATTIANRDKGKVSNLYRWVDGLMEPVAALPVRVPYEVAADAGSVWVVGDDGMLWQVAPDGRTAIFADLAGVVDDTGSFGRAVAAEDGRVHVGMFNGPPSLLTFDTQGGLLADRMPAQLRSNARIDGIYTVSAAQGRLAAGTIGTDTHAWLLVGDAHEEGALRPVRIDEAQAIDQVALDGDVVYATTRPHGHLWRYADGRLRLLATPVPSSETRMLAVEADGTVVGVASEGIVWRVDPDHGRSARLTLSPRSGTPQAPLTPLQHMPMGLGYAGAHLVAGGNWSATVHAPDGSTVNYDIPGEPKSIAGDGQSAWLALYPHAELWRYLPGSHLGDSGLHRFALWDARYNRPQTVTVAEDGHVLIAAHADQVGHGALVRVDPEVAAPQEPAADVGVRLHIDPFGGGLSVADVAAGSGDVAYLAAGVGAAGHDGQLPVVAVDSVSGAERWRTMLPAEGRRLGVASAGSHVAVVVDDTMVFLDRDDGRPLGDVPLPSAPPGKPTGFIVERPDGTQPMFAVAVDEGVAVIDPDVGAVSVHGTPITTQWWFGRATPQIRPDCVAETASGMRLHLADLSAATGNTAVCR